MYTFKLPIGDWSKDGHNECDYFYIDSKKPIDEVREAHFAIKFEMGIDIENIASEYEVYWIEYEDVKRLSDIGFYDYLNELEEFSYVKEHVESLLKGKSRDERVDPEFMAHLWVFLLNKVNPELNLKLQENSIEMIPFFGRDEKGRHISQVGYGLF